METLLIKNPTIINEGRQFVASLLISNGKIEQIIPEGEPLPSCEQVFNAMGQILIPGVIDDQVHFREPGLTYKEDIESGARVAVAGGVTSFMEMPNTNPQTLTIDLLEEKYSRAAEVSLANYSFYMGASNDNLDEVLKVDPKQVCGLKVFMGSSTGNMLVDNDAVLAKIFEKAPLLVATHCEDESTIQSNTLAAKEEYGEEPPIRVHPQIRSDEACFISSQRAVELAKKYNTRLHILHLSSEKEMSLFDNALPLEQKRITAEVCVHHLWFTDQSYDELGTLIKWNPAVKTKSDRAALRNALADGRLDVVATDHAPHTLEEKQNSYFKAPSGGPLVQHSLPLMMELAYQDVFSIEKVVEKMCHNPAICFQIEGRGFIREGYAADLVLIERDEYVVSDKNCLYKCNWSPFHGQKLLYRVSKTFVNGNLVFDKGEFNTAVKGQRLHFNR